VVEKALWLREVVQALLDGFGTCRTGLCRHYEGHLVQWGVYLLGEDWVTLNEARDTLPPPDVVRLAEAPSLTGTTVDPRRAGHEDHREGVRPRIALTELRERWTS
jgi:hypothetical protein